MLSLTMQLNNSAEKARAKDIDLDLRTLELSQAIEHLDIIKVKRAGG